MWLWIRVTHKEALNCLSGDPQPSLQHGIGSTQSLPMGLCPVSTQHGSWLPPEGV